MARRRDSYAALPASLVLRELRYRIEQPGCRTREVILITTLMDPQWYPAEELAGLYGQRWQVETDLRHLKQTLRMDVLRTKTVAGVHKELAMFALVYNLVRLVMLEAAYRQKVPVERISFIDALRWLQQARADQRLGKLEVLPHRPGRHEPRVRKRRPKEYDLMNRPRDELRKALLRRARLNPSLNAVRKRSGDSSTEAIGHVSRLKMLRNFRPTLSVFVPKKSPQISLGFWATLFLRCRSPSAPAAIRSLAS